MKIVLNAFAISMTIGAVALVGGCTTTITNQSSIAQAQELQLTFESAAMAEELRVLGLEKPFTEYWRAHARRDWSAKFGFEKFPRPMQEKFYNAYHANAWALRSLRVNTVNVAPDQVTLEMTINLMDPEKQIERPQYQKAIWLKFDGAWRHVVSDPMLTGSFQ